LSYTRQSLIRALRAFASRAP